MTQLNRAAEAVPAHSVVRARGPVVPLVGLFALGWGSNQFAPLVLFYPQVAPISAVEIQGLFVLYGASIIPMFLIGGWLSDRLGRPGVLMVAIVLAGTSSTILLLDGLHPATISLARVMTGISCGVGFSSGTAWVTESLPAPRGSRLAVVFMTAGMGLGSLFVGVLASSLLTSNVFHPQVWVMMPHILVSIFALALLLRYFKSSGPRKTGDQLQVKTSDLLGHSLRTRAQRGLKDRRFLQIVLPLAPWTLFCTAVPLATLPSALPETVVQDPLLFSAFLTPLPALGALCIQPIAGRARVSPKLLAPLALATAAIALAVSIASVQWQSLSLLFLGCFVFGLAHGFCQTSGLRIITDLSPPLQLGRNTAVFQALSYLGFLAPLPIAVMAESIPLIEVLSGLFLLACLTLVLLLPRRRVREHQDPAKATDLPCEKPPRNRRNHGHTL